MLHLFFFAKYRKISSKVKLTVYGFFSVYLGADGIESPTLAGDTCLLPCVQGRRGLTRVFPCMIPNVQMDHHHLLVDAALKMSRTIPIYRSGMRLTAFVCHP